MKTKYYASTVIVFVVALIALVHGADWFWQRNSDTKSELHAPSPSVCKVFWGMETNGIKAGLSIGYYSSSKFEYFTSDPKAIPIRCFPQLHNSNTNNGNLDSDLAVFDLPTSLESRYRLDLRDEKGNLVEKTKKGEALGKITPHAYKPSPSPFTGVTIDTGWRPARYMLFSNQSRDVSPPLVLQDYFKITNSGVFHLHFEMCAFKVISSETNELIQFPSVDAKIDIK